MGGGIPKPAQRSEAVGHVSEGTRKDGSSDEGTGRNVQCGGTVGVIIWQRDLGGNRVDDQGPDGISPSGGTTNHGDDRETQGRWRVGVSSCRGGNGTRKDPPHWGVHKEVTDKHSGVGVLPARLCTV